MCSLEESRNLPVDADGAWCAILVLGFLRTGESEKKLKQKCAAELLRVYVKQRHVALIQIVRITMQTYRKTKKTRVVALTQGASGVLPSGRTRTEVDAPVIDALSQYETFSDFARRADACLTRFVSKSKDADLAQRSEIAEIVDDLLELAGFSTELRMVQAEYVRRTGYVAPYAAPAGLHREFVHFLRDWILPDEDMEDVDSGEFYAWNLLRFGVAVQCPLRESDARNGRQYCLRYIWNPACYWNKPPVFPDGPPQLPPVLNAYAFFRAVFDPYGFRLPAFGGSSASQEAWEAEQARLAGTWEKVVALLDDLSAHNVDVFSLFMAYEAPDHG